MKKHIPNFLTCLNVLSGSMAVFMGIYGYIEGVVICILCGMIFDFSDGLVARLLHVKSALGKELDSLADVITFGVAPAILAHSLLKDMMPADVEVLSLPFVQSFILFTPLLLPVFSAYRLAKFNLDERQTTHFIGLPVPANALFWVSIVLAKSLVPDLYNLFFSEGWVLVACVVILSFLLISELPMFSLKVSGFSWAENKARYSYILILALLFVLTGWAGLLFIIPLYLLICIICALCQKQ
ncbi:CDP-diacylglycerol--serine O-phosphatidyltransferase [Bacteroidia bacterium]|nr:CDP-diacylglycerol--serine O-phosphatidyltransferase [Bacteroidia bacterium]